MGAIGAPAVQRLREARRERDRHPVHLKLDELIRVMSKARRLLDAEELSDNELDALEAEFRQLRRAPRRKRTSTHPS